jgi:hypothetical protein
MRRLKAVLAMATLAGGVLVASPGVASVGAAPASPGVTVASGLDNPRQIAVGHDGSLYVAEAGKGQLDASDQSGGCTTGPEGDPICGGNTSAITRIEHPGGTPEASRVVSGLLSFAGPDGSGATGIDAVTVTRSGTLFGIETYGPANTLPASVAAQNGKLLRFNDEGQPKAVADIGSYSLAHQLAGHEPDTDPYGVLVRKGTVYVADAATNAVYSVKHGAISLFAAFESHTTGPIDGVPTSIARRGERIYVGQLSSLEPGQAKVTVFDRHGDRIRTITGLSSVTGVAVADNGDVYATEIFTGIPFQSDGALVKIPADGGPQVTTPLPAPGGVAVEGHDVYVSINSVMPGTGSVIRLPR